MNEDEDTPPSVDLRFGDCLAVLRELADESVDVVITDPPYGLADLKPTQIATAFTAWLNGDRDHVPDGRGFMGRAWDSFVPPPAVWDECLRVLKPGGHLAAFAGSRTYDLMGMSIRLAGFEIRDGLQWIMGSGMPKGLNVEKATGDPTWVGWNTSLKPAVEPVVLARKPLASAGTNVLKMVELALRERGVEGLIEWTSAPVSAAAKRSRRTSSSSTAAQPAAETSVATAAANGTPNVARPTASSSVPSTQPGGTRTATTSERTTELGMPSCETQSFRHTAESVPAAVSTSESSSLSTTSTAAAPLTDGQSGGTFTPSSAAKDSPTVTESFAGIATGLTTSRAAVRIDRLTNRAFVWPEGLPRYVPGAPCTVAANVLATGCGAMNVDACRVRPASAADEAGYRAKCSSVVGLDSNRTGDSYGEWTGARTDSASDAGRWPANVLLTHAPECHEPGECAPGCPVAELDAQSGILKTGRKLPGVSPRRGRSGGIMGETTSGEVSAHEASEGGASRYFPSFRYQAKAPAAERPKIDGKGWPTVKPQGLMRWLVRLLTPPGGVVLDPFAGTSATLQAARDEGFASIGIERDEFAYLLSCRRLGLPELVPATVTDEPVAQLPEPAPVDPVLAAIAAASSYDELLALWREHRWDKDSAHNEAAAARRAELEGAAA